MLAPKAARDGARQYTRFGGVPRGGAAERRRSAATPSNGLGKISDKLWKKRTRFFTCNPTLACVVAFRPGPNSSKLQWFSPRRRASPTLLTSSEAQLRFHLVLQWLSLN